MRDLPPDGVDMSGDRHLRLVAIMTSFGQDADLTLQLAREECEVDPVGALLSMASIAWTIARAAEPWKNLDRDALNSMIANSIIDVDGLE